MSPLADATAAAGPSRGGPQEDGESVRELPRPTPRERRRAAGPIPWIDQEEEPQAPPGERPLVIDFPGWPPQRGHGNGGARPPPENPPGIRARVNPGVPVRIRNGLRFPPLGPVGERAQPEQDPAPSPEAPFADQLDRAEIGQLIGPNPPTPLVDELRLRANMTRQILTGIRQQLRIIEQDATQIKDRCHRLEQRSQEHSIALGRLPTEIAGLRRRIRRVANGTETGDAEPVPVARVRGRRQVPWGDRIARVVMENAAVIPSVALFLAVWAMVTFLPVVRGRPPLHVTENITAWTTPATGGPWASRAPKLWTVVVSRRLEEQPSWCPKYEHWHQFGFPQASLYRHEPPKSLESGLALPLPTRHLWRELEDIEEREKERRQKELQREVEANGGTPLDVQWLLLQNQTNPEHEMGTFPGDNDSNGTLPMGIALFMKAVGNEDLPGDAVSNVTLRFVELMAAGPEAMTRALAATTLARRGHRDFRTKAVHAIERVRQTLSWYQLQAMDSVEGAAVAAGRLAPGPSDMIGDIQIPKEDRSPMGGVIPITVRQTVDARYDVPPVGPRNRRAYEVKGEGIAAFRLPPTNNEDSRQRRSAPDPVAAASALEFEAYDCSQPSDIQAVTVGRPQACEDRRPPAIVRETTASYVLLQRAAAVPVPVRRCHLVRSKIPAFCGMHSHSTLLTSDVWIKHPVQVSAADCEEMWRTRTVETVSQEYYGTKTNKFSIHRGTTTQVSYTSHGSITLTDNNAHCQGVRWFSQSRQKWVWHVVQSVTDDIILEDDTALVGDDGVMSLTKAMMKLPEQCQPHVGHCITPSGTYLWNPGDNAQCRLYQARRRIEGMEVTIIENEKATTIFNSDDEAIRLVRKDSESRCGTTVYPTNYDELFLAPDQERLPNDFQRPVPPTAMKLALYFKQQGGWIVGHFDGKLKDYLAKLLQRRCEEEQKAKETEFQQLAAKQQAAMAGETIKLGDGLFASASGEAWRRYRCRKVRVVGRNTAKCYDALPVQASAADLERVQTYNRVNVTELFLTPHTRLLTPLAVEVPCAAHLAPLYQNVGGQWIQATPALLPAPAPSPLDEAPALPLLPETTEDMDNIIRGGIYTPPQLEDMEDSRRFPLEMAKGASKFAQVVQESFSSYADPEGGDPFWRTAMLHGLPQLPTLESLATSAIGQVFGVYGQLTQFVLGTYLIWQTVCWLWGVIQRCFFPDPDLPPCLGRLCGGCLPETTRTGYRVYTRRKERRQRAEKVDRDSGSYRGEVQPGEDEPLAPPEPMGDLMYPNIHRALQSATPRRHVRSASYSAFERPPPFTAVAKSGFSPSATSTADASLSTLAGLVFRSPRDGGSDEGSNVAATPASKTQTSRAPAAVFTAAPSTSSTASTTTAAAPPETETGRRQ
jgi:hypothetical protein